MKLRKAKIKTLQDTIHFCHADAGGDVNANADAEMLMSRFPNGHLNLRKSMFNWEVDYNYLIIYCYHYYYWLLGDYFQKVNLQMRYVDGDFNLNKRDHFFLRFLIMENFIKLLLVELKAGSANLLWRGI